MTTKETKELVYSNIFVTKIGFETERLLALKSALVFSDVENFGGSKTRTEKRCFSRGFVIVSKMFRSTHANEARMP